MSSKCTAASQKYDLARDIVTAIETVDKDGSYDDCAFYVSRDGIRILRTAEELIDALGDENGKRAARRRIPLRLGQPELRPHR